ncbi:hypothetical protein O77CONTIG1_00899 [Leptolyngbya sp. O-77]|nr:hypothetical protein O77CONTIG1_00899 [Leptolyngbya sp. O-77]
MNLHVPEDALTLALVLGAIALALSLRGWLLRVAGSLISSAISIDQRHGAWGRGKNEEGRTKREERRGKNEEGRTKREASIGCSAT